MKNNISKLLVFLIMLLLKNNNLFAQLPLASVNNLTGAGSVNMPLYELRSGKISMPISLNYTGSGIKVKEAEGTGGLGWNLQAGGGIYRQLRGLPDESLKDNMGNQRLGWLNNTNGSKINSFNINNDNNQSTCTDESNDLAYLNSNFSDLSDTEPDIFIVNAPGLSCKLVFDADHNVRTIPYQDIKVSYEYETSVPTHYSSYGRIKSFVITTASGTKYTFAALQTSTKHTLSSSPGSISFFKREYQQFQNGLEYVSAWNISSIKDIGGAGFDFFYGESSFSAGTDRLALSQGTSTTTMYPFTISNWTNQTQLSRITYGGWDDVAFNQGLEFHYRSAPTSGAPLIDSITGMGKKYFFSYYSYKTNNNSFANKTLLERIWVNNKQDLYFTYNGISNDGGVLNLPDSNSKAIDVWGYYNGSSESSLLPQVYINPSDPSREHYRNIAGGASGTYNYTVSGATRGVNQTAMMAGTLSSIYAYENGGSTSFEYEPNDYFDATAGTVIQGGGLRVKKLTISDGVNPSGNIVTNYSYLNPVAGLSSGKPVSVPLLSFTTPFYGSGTTEYMLQNSVIRLEENISQEDTGILYSHIRVSKPGAGSSLYEYLIPATNWDNSWGSDWSPTISNFGRASCVSGSYMTNEKNTYPFAPNTNYDFERGLIKKLGQYDENGNKVSESVYTYARSNSPLVINALRFEGNAGAMAYSKYTLYAGVGNLIAQEDNTVFDAPSVIQANHITTSYLYGSPQHKEVTTKTQVKSDGSTARTYFKYIKDYGASTSSDPMVQSIYNLALQGVNIPVESYSQLERNGVNRTVSASLMDFKTWGFNYRPSLDLPFHQFNFLNAVGVSDFQPSGITGGVFSKDSRYVARETILDYDKNANPTTVLANGINKKAVITDQLISSPVAIFEHAGISEVAYENFELHYLETGFTYSVNPAISSFVTTARSGSHAFSLDAGNTLSRTVTKFTGRKYYLFSLWINTATSGNINVSTNGVSQTLPYSNTGGQWKYYQARIPVGSFPDSFVISFQSSTAILIDDIMFYPADALVSTSGYDENSFVKTSTTNTNGRAEYYIYDKWLRLKNVLDDNKNITLKKTYISKNDQDNYKAEISYDANHANTNYPLYFSDGALSNWDSEGLSYTWNFGDGSSTTNSSALYGQILHTYTAPGSYSVTLTKSLAPYGTVSDTKTVTVTNSTENVRVYGGGMTISFYQGTTLAYVFNDSDFASGNVFVGSGTYNIRISAPGQYTSSNPYGYRSIRYQSYTTPTTGVVNDCLISQPANNYFYYFNGVNLSGKQQISFSTSTEECVVEEVQ
ncbi:PKD domain-containing protein [Pedobacter sp. KBW01]|uniref:PKD domain-containing protein n=1 Tax=Pedobacter sp. KBW01 TaxID=2153364 RepID=UPI000F5A96FE|nr:PKD domain-containing protein [Pedobacter sp. KBW01]